MRKNILVIVFSLMAFVAMGQVKVPGTRVSFDFPNGGWKYLQTTQVDNNTTVYLYAYNKSHVVDMAGDTILPFLRIYVRKNYKPSIFELAYERYMQQPFQSLTEYSDGLPAEGLGYVGAYKNPNDRKDYEFRMIYFKERINALEFRLETTSDTYDAFDSEFVSILETITIE